MSSPSEMVLTVLPSRPRGELFDDPVCNGLWAALMKVDVALQWEFLLRLRVQLLDPEATGNSDGVRLARMVMSVREAYELYAAECEAAADSAGSEDEVAGPAEPVVLSEKQFERLRERRRELNWMSARTCKRLARGDWNAVLRRCRLEEVPGGDVLVAQDGGKMAWPEVRDGLQGYAAAREADGADQPWEFSFHDYLAWARLPETRAMPGRRPMSQSPFDRHGGFTACRHAAMRGDNPPNAADRAIKTRSSRVRPTSGYGIERPQMRKSIRAVKKSLKRVPRAADYTRERDHLRLDAELNGRPIPLLVSYNRIVEEYGGWDAALIRLPRPQPDDQPALSLSGAVRGRVATQPFGLREKALGAGKQRPAGLGQLDPAAVALEEPKPEVAFERGDLLRQRRGGDVEPGGRLTEVQLLGDGDEGLDLPQAHPVAESVDLACDAPAARVPSSARPCADREPGSAW